MRSLSRNQIRVFYATFIEVEPVVDPFGYETGEYHNIFTEPTEVWVGATAPRGFATDNIFGKDTNYNAVISVTGMNLPWAEGTRLWVGVEPTEKHNFVVAGVHAHLNTTTYAIKRGI